MTPEERHAALTATLHRDRESAWQIAHYERGQRDEYTSKLRFGLAALNAASLVTILNLAPATLVVGATVSLLSSFLFLVGTALAGYSLLSHQTHLILLAGSTSARALSLDRAVSLTSYPVGSREHDLLGIAMDEAHGYQGQTYTFSNRALNCQWGSAVIWILACAVIATATAITFLPSWHSILARFS